MENLQMFDDEIFFFGEFEHSLDAQGRLTIPSNWRREGETRLILMPGRNKDLVLYPFETFRNFLREAGKLSLANKELQAALSRIGARTRDCRCDKQGRIKIDKNMLDAIGVSNQLKVIGAMTHIRLCSIETYQQSENLGDDAYFDEFKKITDSVANFVFPGGV